MTYCVGLLLESGIVMLSDTRTNAGFDNIACYRKMFVFETSGERVAVDHDRRQPVGHPDGDRQAQAGDRARGPGDGRSCRRRAMLHVAEIVGRTLNDVYVGRRTGG